MYINQQSLTSLKRETEKFIIKYKKIQITIQIGNTIHLFLRKRLHGQRYKGGNSVLRFCFLRHYFQHRYRFLSSRVLLIASFLKKIFFQLQYVQIPLIIVTSFILKTVRVKESVAVIFFISHTINIYLLQI